MTHVQSKALRKVPGNIACPMSKVHSLKMPTCKNQTISKWSPVSLFPVGSWSSGATSRDRATDNATATDALQLLAGFITQVCILLDCCRTLFESIVPYLALSPTLLYNINMLNLILKLKAVLAWLSLVMKAEHKSAWNVHFKPSSAPALCQRLHATPLNLTYIWGQWSGL